MRCAFQGAHYLLQVVYLPTPNCRLWEVHFWQIAHVIFVFPPQRSVGWNFGNDESESFVCSRTRDESEASRSGFVIHVHYHNAKLHASGIVSFFIAYVYYISKRMTLKPNIIMPLVWLTHSAVCSCYNLLQVVLVFFRFYVAIQL